MDNNYYYSFPVEQTGFWYSSLNLNSNMNYLDWFGFKSIPKNTSVYRSVVKFYFILSDSFLKEYINFGERLTHVLLISPLIQVNDSKYLIPSSIIDTDNINMLSNQSVEITINQNKSISIDGNETKLIYSNTKIELLLNLSEIVEVPKSKPYLIWLSKEHCCWHCLFFHRAIGVPPILDSTCCFWWPDKSEHSCEYYWIGKGQSEGGLGGGHRSGGFDLP